MILLLLSAAFAAPPENLVPALEAELERATTELKLQDDAPPYWVSYDVVDGTFATYFAEMGAVISEDETPYRVMRVETRAGDPSYDSGNFDAFGEGNGVLSVRLPKDDNEEAFRRSIWLATDASYKQAVQQLSRKQAELPPSDPAATALPAMLPAEPVVDLSGQALPLDGEKVQAAVVALSAVLAEYPELEQGQAAGRDWQGQRTVVSSEGTRLVTDTGYTVIRVEAVLKHSDGSRLRNGRWWVARTAAELPPMEEMEAEVREMAEWLVALERAPVLKEYLGPVLFEQPASVELYRQLAASEFVGTPPEAQGRGMFGEAPISRPTARVGRRLMPAGWTVVDDPTAPAAGRYVLDQEGVPGQQVVLVEDGVVRRVLNSRIPAKGAQASTGHGRSMGTERREALPSNVRVSAKRARSERVLRRKGLRMAAQTQNEGLLVIRRIEPPAMSEDMDITFMGEGPGAGLTRPYEAYLLMPDGSEQPVRGLQFSGVDRRALRDVVVAGETGDAVGVMDGPPGPERFYLGAVGGLPASWAVPPVLVSELELDGSGGGDKRVLARPE